MQASQTVALFSYLRGKRVSGRAPLVSDLMLRLVCNFVAVVIPLNNPLGPEGDTVTAE